MFDEVSLRLIINGIVVIRKKFKKSYKYENKVKSF